jgi:hypothetical protein
MGSGLMGASAVGFIADGVMYFIRNFTDMFRQLGIDADDVNVGAIQIQDFSPSLYHYVDHLQIALAGLFAATGVALLFLAAFGVRRGYGWAWIAAVASPLIALSVALPANRFTTIGHTR